jgi:hypothetical protein
MLFGNYAGCSAAVVDRELFMLHRFNTDRNLTVFEDWELWLRLIDKNDLHCLPHCSILMTNDGDRSVLSQHPQVMERKILFFRDHATSSIPMVKKSRGARSAFVAGIYSYLAL